jgi:hypothetical protein
MKNCSAWQGGRLPSISYRFFSFVVFYTIYATSFAQQGVSVNYQTGTAGVSIPIYSLHTGNLSVPVTLTYAASGVHVNDIFSEAGIGWALNAGGVISRQVRDLPDDVKQDGSGANRTGWMFNSNGTLINNFTLANDNNPSTCPDEASDINYINANFSNLWDLQPDIFTVSAPGLNCRLVYDNVAGMFRTIPYQDLVITYTLGVGNGGIATNIVSFTITNDKGITYIFGQPDAVGIQSANPGTITTFARQYACYQNDIHFASNWYLTSIMDAGGNNIIFRYAPGQTTISPTPVTSIFGSGPSSWTSTNQYTLNTTATPQFLRCAAVYNLDYTVDSVHINRTTSHGGYYGEISSITGANGKTFNFNYSWAGNHTQRDFLQSFGEYNCDPTSWYQFSYTGINFPNYTSTLPDSGSVAQDYWGYYNGGTTAADLAPQLYVFPDNPSYPNLERYRLYPVPSYPGTYFIIGGNDRSANASYITAGTLSQMVTPLGGTVTFTYEPNDYYDVSAGTTHLGEGIRIKQLLFYDGVNPASNVTKNYTYTDPSTGITTGEPIALPQFAFTLPNSGDPGTITFWNTATVRNALNVSKESTVILYGKVKEQQAGAGSSLYQFNNPGTFWQTSASPDWTPTMVDVGAPTTGGTCPIYYVKNSTYNYPFPPNVNYDFERGLLSTVTRYNDAAIQVGQTVYAYQRAYSTPVKIPGFAFETASTAYYYAKYNLYLATSELTSTVTNYVNDLGNTTNDPTKQHVTTSNYYYQSPYHKLATKIESVNTDGSTNRQYIQYAKDYNASTATDGPSTSIKGMISLNQNYPIERYWTVTRGGTELAFAAELDKYGQITPANTPYMYLPVQRLSFASGAGVNNFAFSSINGSGNFVNYPGYIPTVNYTAFDPSGTLMTSDDTHNNRKTNIIEDWNLTPIATITNASATEVGVSCFEGNGTDQFSIIGTGGSINAFGRTGSSSCAMATSTVLSRSLTLHTGAKHYVFSGWLNAATAGTLTVSLLNSGGTQVATAPIAFGVNGIGQWQYYEVKLPTTSVSGNFSVNVQSSVAINIDDVLFYPENSEVTSYSRNIYTGLLMAKTVTNGVAEYYGYDNLLRPQYVYDQDKNIVLKRTYVNTNALATYASANFSFTSGTIYVNNSVTFTGPSNTTCEPGTSYAWNFGDGTTLPATLGAYQVTHAYATAGTYTVTLNTSNSIFGNKQTSQPVTISAGTLGVSICQAGVISYKPGVSYSTTTCPPNYGDNRASYFYLTGITNAPPSPRYSYQWQIIYTDGGSGSTAWANYGTNLTNTSVSFNLSTSRPFNMRLLVSELNTGNSGTSNVLSLTNLNNLQ